MGGKRDNHLYGVSDVTIPGARERTLEAVRISTQGSVLARSSGADPRTTFHYRVPFAILLREAAKARGISISGYVRRAVAAFIAYDTGKDVRDILVHAPGPTAYGRIASNLHQKTFDDSTGFGLWRIERLW